ncbi:MAG: bifunctional riboflavin kinase/FAD synthetase [Christensenellales bacterium]|jgi:riboflavin kinase/FMN adenylyltransferase
MIYNSLHGYTGEGSCVVLGMFDGVHAGHRSLIRAAAENGGGVSAFTFSNHPSAITGKEQVKLLMTPEEKAKALQSAGVRDIIMVEFTQQLASLSPRRFVDLLAQHIRPRCAVAGFNYRFGSHAGGSAETLRLLLSDKGIDTIIAESVMYEGQAVSSSRIRAALLEGDTELAAAMLGSDYMISGRVIHGKAIGRKLGAPTANIDVDKSKLLPMDGVYACIAHVDGESHKAVCNIGPKPTVDVHESGVEAHILGYRKRIYGGVVTLSIKRRLRGIVDFGSKEALREQIIKDCAEAAKLDSI